jgi:hypothetical protein
MTSIRAVVTLLKAENLLPANQLPPALAGGKKRPNIPPALAKHYRPSYILLFCFG